MRIAINNDGFIIKRYDDSFLILNPHLNTEDLFEISDEEASVIFQFKNPKKVNNRWIEGTTPEEIAELKTSDLTLRITNAFTYLRQRALASSIGKPISLGWEYIKEQADQYRYKYAVANGDIVDANMMASIEDEAQDFGITAEQMKQLIIERFLQGQSAYLFFTGMIERGRTKALTKLELLDFESAEEIVILMENVPEVLSMEDAVELNNQMLAI